jgi:hypothetical protein
MVMFSNRQRMVQIILASRRSLLSRGLPDDPDSTVMAELAIDRNRCDLRTDEDYVDQGSRLSSRARLGRYRLAASVMTTCLLASRGRIAGRLLPRSLIDRRLTFATFWIIAASIGLAEWMSLRHPI